ncbi:hypothetical protein HH308_15905 [Gordonia sp. TBRC 11910]|uniref:Uncharacterized protein n=1 Tax=Gordonia asplenii TaxID=2725283 RepID=A0A848KX83_9ACTN|nr:hypothetical protein [Gordonia asplenii]NMO02697.1 hypothetical protein [Gordonia asplenii]
MGHVLGIAVVDRQIASVVHDADGALLASNLVELDVESPSAVEAAINDLVDSVPYDIDSIGLACADPTLTETLSQRFVLSPGRPAWYESVTVTDIAPALAQVGVTESRRPGTVAIVNLDENSAPAPGTSIVTVDTTTGIITAGTDFDAGHRADEPSAVVDPAGANTVADAIAAMPGGDAVTSVICTGPGAALPGVAPAFEYAMQRPVQIASQPLYAIASGAASMSTRLPVLGAAADPDYDRANRRRWAMIIAAVAGAFFVATIAGVAVLFGTGTAQRVVEGPTLSVTTETVTPPAQTVTTTVVQQGDETTRVRTVTPPARTVTRTVRPDGPTPTVTVSETATVTVTETVQGGIVPTLPQS